jgi:aspartate racemase
MSGLTVGVLGGMGPEATVDFMAKVIALTPAERDQDHIHMLVDQNPQVPDRQQAMKADDAPVRRALRDMAVRLEAGGADFLVMPCNTAHAFIAEAIAAVSIPFVSIVDVTVQSIIDRTPRCRSVGLLATDACLDSGVYQRAMASAGLELVLPDADRQAECMALIARIKGGDTGDEVCEGMAALAAAGIKFDVDVIIAGCTEIPLVLKRDAIRVPLISSTDMLASRAVDLAIGRAPLPPATHQQKD